MINFGQVLTRPQRSHPIRSPGLVVRLAVRRPLHEQLRPALPRCSAGRSPSRAGRFSSLFRRAGQAHACPPHAAPPGALLLLLLLHGLLEVVDARRQVIQLDRLAAELQERRCGGDASCSLTELGVGHDFGARSCHGDGRRTAGSRAHRLRERLTPRLAVRLRERRVVQPAIDRPVVEAARPRPSPCADRRLVEQRDDRLLPAPWSGPIWTAVCVGKSCAPMRPLAARRTLVDIPDAHHAHLRTRLHPVASRCRRLPTCASTGLAPSAPLAHKPLGFRWK
jgi:hypothetical protein